MKKIYIFAAVIALLTLSLNAQMTAKKKVAQTQQATSTEMVKQPSIDLNFYKQALTNTLNGPKTAPNRANASVIVCDGTATSSYVPFQGLYFDDNYQIDQMIYPESLLTDLVGKTITSITFFANSSISSNLNTGRFTFKIGTTSQTQFSTPVTRITAGMTTVATGMLMSNCISGSQLVIDFSDNPFTYQGGNLVLDYELTTLASGYKTTTFYGENGHDNASFYGKATSNSTNSYGVYNNSTNTAFLPKVAFGYTSNDPTITASPSSINLACAKNESATESVTVTGENLTGGITAAISGTDASLFSVSPASLGTSGGSLTVTYSPTAVGNHTATLTLSSTGAQDVTISLTGTCSNEKYLTVCDGQYVAQYFPYYGYYHDESEHIQMIYPASILGSSMAGCDITSMTFYPTTGSVTWSNGTTESASGINFYNGSITFKVANLTNAGAFDTSSPSFVNATLTAVSTISMPGAADANATTWVITFDQPFEYTGGDLLIDVTNPTTGQWGLTFFAGDDTGDNAYSYITSGGPTGALAFLPKVTFTYEDSEDQHDLAIALSAPATAGAGSTVNVTATVTNNGDFAENGYTVTVTDGTNIVTITATEELPVGQSAEFTVQFTTSSNAGGQTVNYTATVACTDDAVAANNSATASTSLINLPPPVNVAATPSGTSATVTWDAPTIAPVQQNLAWDFETSSQFNDWTLVSTDNDSYNWTYNTYVEGSSASIFEPHSGTGYIVSPSFVNNVGALNPDNWLISPEVTLGGTFTFWAKGTDATYYAENFGVFVYEGSYSSGVSGFVQVDVDQTATAGWVKYTFDLSQYSGQGRIAIRHYDCTDQYWLEVDDIEYQVTVPGEQPTSYNVYLDGVLVGSVNANDPLTYDFSNLTDGQHTAEISAVYTLGESALVPATFTISSTNPELAISPADQTIDDNAAGSLTVTGTDIEGNISVSAADNTNWSLNPTSLSSNGGSVNVSYTGRELSATTTVTASATGATDVTATVNYVADLYIVGNFGSGWNFSDNSHPMTYANGTYTATLTANAGDYIVFARLLGNDNPWNTRDIFGPVSSGDWWMQGDSNGGNLNLYASNCIYFPEGGTYRITIDANAGTFTITKLNGEQTAPPVITSSSDGEHVTITATGDGTVTLNVPGQDPVSGEGEVSITVPCGYVSNTITVTATAQEDGKDESDPATAQIEIPAGSDWVEMDGTYDDPNTLLSFLKDAEDIMMLDQFKVSTFDNGHADGYIYTLREDRGGEQKMSTPVPIPVYKTFSTMQGVYTKNQVDNDKNMKLKANVLNAEMDFNVAPDGNVLYYNLYRSNLNGDYPVIDDTHRVSKLQQFDEQVGDYSQFFLFESHTSGVIPRYDHFGNGIVERLDTNYVQGEEGNELSYVPVIWTLGINSARGDGKDNSYGSDIKRETLGNVTAEISGTYTKNNTYGTWDVNDVEYCVFHPTIEVTGVLPQAPLYRVDYNDGDYAEYEPYMCRAWCTYEGIHDFIRNSEGNLEDAGALTTPYWLGDATFDNSLSATIGGEWTGGAIRDQWSFGLPSTTNPNEVTYIIRFYYKKVVTDAQNQQNGGSGAKVGGEDEVYFMTQTGGEYGEWVVGINELYTTIVPVDVTYVNPQGMQSNRPFDGVNIVVTRYSDGSTRTTKIIR